MIPDARIQRRSCRIILALLLPFLAWTGVASALADDREQRDLVDQSRMTFSNFLADSNMTWFRPRPSRRPRVCSSCRNI